MGRSGYTDDCDGPELNLWRGAVESAIRGRRGQAFLKEMLAALDALERKELISDALEADGAVCALGAVGKARGMDLSRLPYDAEEVAKAFGISGALAKEIMFENDEDFTYSRDLTSGDRFARIRRWVESLIAKPVEANP